jgi:uncharacterized protein YaiI (UPF0178 family)
LINIYVDADASPVKDEAVRVAKRYGLKVYLVSNSNSRMKIPAYQLVERVVVNDHMDAADDWIVEHITENDVVVSADVPLASRCIKKGARVLDPNGRILTEESIGEALSHRDIMTFLRDTGTMAGWSPPYHKQDRSRFLQRLDDLVHAIRKGK